MKLKLYWLGILTLLYSYISAQVVSPEKAEHIANIFIQETYAHLSTRTNKTSIVQPVGKNIQSPTMYSVSKDSIWVLVAADERVTPILAYSDIGTGTFPMEKEMSHGMIELLNWYEQQIQFLRDSITDSTIHEEWNTLQVKSSADTINDFVLPLLDARGRNRWKQSGNNGNGADIYHSYNKYCPVDNGVNTIAGCVAVAMGQLMWYWQWPHVAIVEDDNGHKLIREYNWKIMPGVLTNDTSISSVDMVAHLLHDIGISVDMNYGINSSSANPSNIPNALIYTFYFQSDELIHREDYTSAHWFYLLKENLKKGLPILYGGRNVNNEGHRFIIDGYDASDRFHINYGWGGATAYFTLTTIVDPKYEFHLSQSAILNIYPNYPVCIPWELSYNESWYTNFIIQKGGEITISNKIIESAQSGVIYSGNSIRLMSGFHAKSGCQVHIAVKDQHCGEDSSLSQANDSTLFADSTNNKMRVDECITSNSMNNIMESDKILSTSVFTISGQLLQTIEGGQRDATHLPNGMYILQHHMSDGSTQSEKIANNK